MASTPPSDLEPGFMVSDRLRLVRLLGEGGMGSVWVAEHLTLDTEVAIKFISREFATHPGLIERFQREARAASRIKSAHVARTLDFGTMPNGIPYLVMELLVGESLAERLERETRLRPATAATVITQVARALDEAHSSGIIHRDIKPANIFLTKQEGELFVKLVDFGIARDVSSATSATQTGALLGTPQYMSPEQLMSAKGVDLRADLWALAVTAYECVTGTPPFAGETIPALIVSIHGGDFAPPSSRLLGQGLADADAFFGRALAKEPEHRFASAAELARAFEQAVSAAAALSPGRLESERSGISGPASAPTLLSPPLTTGAGVAAPSSGVAPASGSRLRLILGGVLVLLAAIGCYSLLVSTPRAGEQGDPASGNLQFDPPKTPSDAPSTSAALAPTTTEPRIALNLPSAAVSTRVGIGREGSDAPWMLGFTARHVDASTSAGSAMTACRQVGMALCTDPQWRAACRTDPAIGSRPTWTGSASRDGVIVRGGDGCDPKRNGAISDGPFATLCCDQAVAVVGKNDGFLRATATKLTDYQRAMNAGSADALGAIYADSVLFLVKQRSRAELRQLAIGYFNQNPDQAQLYGPCNVQVNAPADEWTAACDSLLLRGGKGWYVRQSFAFGGVSGRLLRVGELEVVSVPDRPASER